MKDNSIEHPLYVQIQGDIDRVEELQTRNRRLYYAFRISQIVLTGGMTLLSGMDDSNHTMILLLGVLVTTTTAIETLFRFDSKKDSFSLALFDYRSIRDDFVFYHIQGNVNSETERELFDRFVKAKSGHRKLIAKDAPAIGQSEMAEGAEADTK